MREQGRLGPIEWAMAGRPILGASASGDHGIALDAGSHAALFGVIDGLGHGEAAAVAAQCAADVLSANRAEPVDVLMLMCHRALVDTRGAAVTLASFAFEDDELRWAAVGNVGSCVVGATPTGPTARATALLSAGIVGYRLPPQLQTSSVTMRPGDLLLMVSDGIFGDYVDDVDLSKPAPAIAADILAAHDKETDDAFVLAARHRGISP